jgi:hypothetical protein
VSLTSHIRDLDSPIRHWMAVNFPDCRDALRDMRDDLPNLTGRTIAPPGRASSTVGMALDYRIRLYFEPPQVETLVAWEGATMAAREILGQRPKGYRESRDGELLRWSGARHTAPAAFFRAFSAFLERHPPTRERLPGPQELRLARYCYVLGLYEEVFRIGYTWPPSYLGGLAPDADARAVLAIVPDARVKDIARISGGCQKVLSPYLDRPYVLNPTFAGSGHVGGADADLILDGRLIEIKTTADARLDQGWLLQLLGYVLLDWDDEYKIDGIGVLYARQAALARWRLDEVLRKIGGGGIAALPRLRREFRDLLMPQQRVATRGGR